MGNAAASINGTVRRWFISFGEGRNNGPLSTVGRRDDRDC
ncbi:hypothetical protein AESSP_02186 [Aestuariimicrobium sp. T2.26MG-19.2B]|nr:hypothetical protein AESSP_02186 [Aestuariimicrobium sp. T2.26MG-19.2B]